MKKQVEYVYLITSLKVTNNDENKHSYVFEKDIIKLQNKISSPEDFLKLESGFIKASGCMSIISICLLSENKIQKEEKNEKNDK